MKPKRRRSSVLLISLDGKYDIHTRLYDLFVTDHIIARTVYNNMTDPDLKLGQTRLAKIKMRQALK